MVPATASRRRRPGGVLSCLAWLFKVDCDMRRKPYTRRWLSILAAAWVAGGLLSACDRSEQDESGYFTANEQPDPPQARAESPDQQSTSRETRSSGVDSQDDPKAPRVLPRTNELPGWVKVKPVQVAGPAELEKFLSDERLVKALRTFQLEQISVCGYEWPGATADVLFFEAGTPTDAFGIFSLLTQRGGHQVRPVDGTIRVIEAGTDAWKMLAWQGKTCLLLRFPGSVTTPAMNAVGQLCNRIVFGVPSADAPLIMQVIPQDRLADAKVWAVRSTTALRAVPDVKMAQVSTSDLDSRLGLTGDAWLWIAAVRPPRVAPLSAAESQESESGTTGLAASPVLSDDVPNMIWVVQYADAASAIAAHQRYEQALAAPQTDLDRNTRVEPVRGTYLAGTWTMDVDATYPLLRPLAQTLPLPMPEIVAGTAAPASGPAAVESAPAR